MLIKAGTRLRSQVDETEVVVVRSLPDDLELSCGGHPMVEASGDAPAKLEIDPSAVGGTQLGKRYAQPETGFEVLIAKPGQGSLALNGEPLELKQARPLPASD